MKKATNTKTLDLFDNIDEVIDSYIEKHHDYPSYLYLSDELFILFAKEAFSWFSEKPDHGDYNLSDITYKGLRVVEVTGHTNFVRVGD